MFICASGDIHGAMDRLYQDVFKFEATLGVRFDYVLHVGDFGGVRCIGLNKVAMPGNLVAIEMESGERDWSLFGEYTQR